jgi:hypothetical protein
VLVAGRARCWQTRTSTPKTFGLEQVIKVSMRPAAATKTATAITLHGYAK